MGRASYWLADRAATSQGVVENASTEAAEPGYHPLWTIMSATPIHAANADTAALRLAEKLIQLLDEGSFTATYKYAVIIGLLDLSLELTEATGLPPDVITTRQLAEKIIELYWPQCTPYGEHVLRQSSTGGQAEIITYVRKFRESIPANTTGAASIARARAAAKPGAYEALVRKVEWKLVEMPLPKVQVISGEEDRFLYHYNFSRHMENSKPLRPYWDGDLGAFDNRLLLRPGVGATLVALNGLMRPLVYRQWAMMVARMNKLEEASLERFMFGADRATLDPVRPALRDLQGGLCFYCGDRLARAHHVDHFIPWSRHPDDGIHNLVVADERCNLNKRDYLASAEHVESWRLRSRREATSLAQIAEDQRWEMRPDRTLGAARAIYHRMPEGAWVWQGADNLVELVEIEKQRIIAALVA